MGINLAKKGLSEFIHLFGKNFLSVNYLPDTVLGVGNIAVSKNRQNSGTWWSFQSSSEGRKQSK